MSGSDTGAARAGVTAMSPATVVLALALLMGLQPITTDLYLPAMPQLARELHAPMAGVQLTMSVLLLAFGFGQLLMGPVSDRFGRRPVLLGGLGLYTLASLAATLAPGIVVLVAMRGLQGVGMAASVVCARAMVRDLYEPHQGATVMSRGLSGLGLIAFLSPTVGGVAAAWAGWRGALGLVTLLGLGMGLFVALKVPETARTLNPRALALGPLATNLRAVMAHASFRAWALLVSFTYAGLFVMLAGSSFVYTGALGVPTWAYGLAMASASISYLVGTFACRRWLPSKGLAGTVRLGGAFTLAGGVLMLALGLGGVNHIAPVLLAQWLYSFGHGIHQPCGQSGAVGPFPRMAGTASALAGFLLSLTAFGVGLWMGQAMDGSLKMLAIGVFTAASATAAVAWTLVQRDGEHLVARPA